MNSFMKIFDYYQKKHNLTMNQYTNGNQFVLAVSYEGKKDPIFEVVGLEEEILYERALRRLDEWIISLKQQ